MRTNKKRRICIPLLISSNDSSGITNCLPLLRAWRRCAPIRHRHHLLPGQGAEVAGTAAVVVAGTAAVLVAGTAADLVAGTAHVVVAGTVVAAAVSAVAEVWILRGLG